MQLWLISSRQIWSTPQDNNDGKININFVLADKRFGKGRAQNEKIIVKDQYKLLP